MLWFCALACVVVASSVPAGSAVKRTIDALPISDKLGHFLAYFVLAALPALTETRRSVVLHAAGVVALGFVLEYWQSRYVGRGFDGWDVTANVAGVLSALATAVRLHPRLPADECVELAEEVSIPAKGPVDVEGA